MADQTRRTSSSLRTHRRQVSRTQPILARTSTNDPLDARSTEIQAGPSTSTGEVSQIESRSTTPAAQLQSTTKSTSLQDFSFLTRSEIYHPLTNIDLLPSFRSRLADTSSSLSLSISELLRSGQFRLSATVATERLTSPPTPPPVELFSLFYIRLASLTLLDAGDLAATESLALGDLSSSVYLDPESRDSILPWSLRLIATRLQSLDSSDPHRALTGYYTLADEARKIYVKLSPDDGDSRLIWKARLRDLGIRVANCLVEIGDWDGTKRHLQSLRIGLGEGLDGREEDDMLRGRISLVLLRIGDLDGARRYLTSTTEKNEPDDVQLIGGSYAEALRPLLSMAQGNYLSAAAQFRSGLLSDALARQNQAICSVYAGRLNEAKELLQSLVEDHINPRTVVFNLSIAFDLLSDKSRSVKLGLAHTLAERDGTSHGWEIAPATLKLSN